MANAFWPIAVMGEADSVNSVSASACHICGPIGVSPGQKALLHGTAFLKKTLLKATTKHGRVPQKFSYSKLQFEQKYHCVENRYRFSNLYLYLFLFLTI